MSSATNSFFSIVDVDIRSLRRGISVQRDIWGTHNYMLGISVKIFLKLDVKFRSDKASTENYFTMQVAVPDPSVLDHSSMGASGLELRQTF